VCQFTTLEIQWMVLNVQITSLSFTNLTNEDNLLVGPELKARYRLGEGRDQTDWARIDEDHLLTWSLLQEILSNALTVCLFPEAYYTIISCLNRTSEHNSHKSSSQASERFSSMEHQQQVTLTRKDFPAHSKQPSQG